jgi:hypothetical protein
MVQIEEALETRKQEETEIGSAYEMKAAGTKVGDGNNCTCAGVKCVIGAMHGTADVPVLDESRTPSWTVRKSSQKPRTRKRTD